MEIIYFYPILSSLLIYFLTLLKSESKLLAFIATLPLIFSIQLHTENIKVFAPLLVVLTVLVSQESRKDKIFYYTTILFSYFIFVGDTFIVMQILCFFYFLYISLLYNKVTTQLLIFFFLNLYLFFNLGTYSSYLGIDSLNTLFVLNDVGIGIFFIIILMTWRLFEEYSRKDLYIAFSSTYLLPVIYFVSMKAELTKFIGSQSIFLSLVLALLSIMHLVRFLKGKLSLKDENDLYFTSFIIFVFSILKSLTIYEFMFLELVLFFLSYKKMDKTLILIAILIGNFILSNEENLNYLVMLLSFVLSYRLILIPLEQEVKEEIVEAL